MPGVDGAGIVVARGARVRRIQLGDRVYAYEFGNRQGGFYAEFAAAEAEHVGRVPKGLDLRDAGAVAATGLTALQGIDALGLRPGHTVLIFGASGAVGTMAVQFAASTRGSRHRHGIRRSAGTSGPQARRPSRDRRAAYGIHRIDSERSRPTDWIACLRSPEAPSSQRCLDFMRPQGTRRIPERHRTGSSGAAHVPRACIRRDREST